jgi:hypothetical protein
MLAANMRNAAPDHLTTKNIITPKTQYENMNFCKSIDASGINIEFGINSTGTIETETGKTFSIIVILCLFNPMDKTKQPYKIFTSCMEIEDFSIWKAYNIKLPFDAEEQKELLAYSNCIVYNTVVFDELAGAPRKWISTNALEFELSKGEGESKE